MAAEPDSQQEPSSDPTRDIRLPPLPGPPPPALPAEVNDGRLPEPAPEDPRPGAVFADQPTARLGSPPVAEGDNTLTFDGSRAERWAAGHAATLDPTWSSVPPASRPIVGPRSRPVADRRSSRWPWIVVVLVPVLVIAVSGVWLLLLMRAG